MAKRSGSGVVTADVALGIIARMMAGSSYLDSVLIFGLARSAVYDVFHRTLDALSDIPSLPGIPTSESTSWGRWLSVSRTLGRLAVH